MYMLGEGLPPNQILPTVGECFEDVITRCTFARKYGFPAHGTGLSQTWDIPVQQISPMLVATTSSFFAKSSPSACAWSLHTRWAELCKHGVLNETYVS